MLAFLAQDGAGLYVRSGGVANLDGCNVFSNEAQVRAARAGRPFPDLTSSAPLERYVARLLQWDGGGLNVVGTATLIDSNVYSNQAGVGARVLNHSRETPAPR